MGKRGNFWSRTFLLLALVVVIVMGLSYFQHVETLEAEEAELILTYSQYTVTLDEQEDMVYVLDTLLDIDNEDRIIEQIPYEQWSAEHEEQYGPIQNEDGEEEQIQEVGEDEEHSSEM